MSGGLVAEDPTSLGRPDALSIGQLYDAVDGALVRAFPRGGQLWVRGEIQSITDRTGHCMWTWSIPTAPASATHRCSR